MSTRSECAWRVRHQRSRLALWRGWSHLQCRAIPLQGPGCVHGRYRPNWPQAPIQKAQAAIKTSKRTRVHRSGRSRANERGIHSRADFPPNSPDRRKLRCASNRPHCPWRAARFRVRRARQWRLGLAALMLAALGLIDIHSLSSEDGHPDPRPGGWVQAQLRAGRQGLRQPGIDTGHRAARGAGRDPASQLRAAARPYDKARYRLRSRIERCFAKLKQWRRVATRYDRKPANFMAAVLAASIWLWLQ